MRPPHAASQDASLKSGAELSAGPLTVSVPERSQRNGIALKASVSVAETEAPTTLAGIKLPHRPSSNSAAAGAAHAGGLDSRGRLDASAWGAANADGSAQHLHDDGFEAMLDDHLQPLRNWHTDARGRGPQASTSASTNRAPFIDVISSPPAGVGAAFNRAAKSGDFHRALQILEACVAANRHDMIVMFNHKDFLHTAAERKAVMEALCFIQLLPRAFADARTHNMTLHVCAKARDLKTALQVRLAGLSSPCHARPAVLAELLRCRLLAVVAVFRFYLANVHISFTYIRPRHSLTCLKTAIGQRKCSSLCRSLL